MLNVLFQIEMNVRLCILICDILLISMATLFHIKYVTGTSNESYQVVIIVKINST